jgi:Protein of unknown function (DUF1579)
MKLKVWLGACAVVFSSIVFAQDQPKMSPEEKAEMDAMMKAGTPGDAHKKLSSMIGTWDAAVKMYPMKPGAPVQQSTGTSESKWVLGGRWVQEMVTGSMMGMPFYGIGYTGYDNIKKVYTGTWMDSMSTSTMLATGNMSNDKTWEFTSTMDDPMSGKSMQIKQKVTVVDDDHHVMEMWGPMPDGKMMKMMEITYTRKK